MSLEWLEIQRVRNISQASLELSPGVNLLYGQNGSGKTSVLESVYFLASSRSFRRNMNTAMIQQGAPDCLVLGRGKRGQTRYQMGVQRDRQGERDIRINGDTISRASELARMMPTLQLGPERVDLLLGTPTFRRQFLNWGVFHMEHRFSALWEAANRSLRQRNLALRQGASPALGTWTAQVAQQAEEVDRARTRYVAQYEPIFQALAAEMLGLEDVKFAYYRGWESGASLLDIYAKDLSGDIKKGHTQRGFQRADVRIEIEGQPAASRCSRGELKALVWSMVLAQGSQLETGRKQDILYLVDDLAAEFDSEHRQRILGFLAAAGHQVLLTGIERDMLIAACDGVETKMFHVKQGEIQEV